MGAFRRALTACVVAGLGAATGCHTPESFEAPAERPRPLPPAIAKGGTPAAGYDRARPEPSWLRGTNSFASTGPQPNPTGEIRQASHNTLATGAGPNAELAIWSAPSEAHAPAQPVPLPDVPPAPSALPPPQLEVLVTPAPEPATEWRAIREPEPLRPPVVVPEPRQ
jgi:hypothetical protein